VRKIKIKKIDSFAALKTSLSICSILGLIIGVILGLTSIPIKTTTALNGQVVQTKLLNNFWTSLFGVVFGTMFYFIAVALFITLVIIAYNFFSKITGGITVEIEKE
jgi:hypothetical protein